jgi:hypothetical protein
VQRGGFPLNSANVGPLKHTKFTEQEIMDYLVKFKEVVEAGKYTISVNENRNENKQFIEDYNIDTEKERGILLSLDYLDFCYAVDNSKPQYAHEKLYVFCVSRELASFGDQEIVEIYIKTNLMKTRKGNDFAVVISLHKLNKKISYLFK